MNQIIGSEYSVFNNLPIKNDIDDRRLILHIGGGKYREKVLLEIISIFNEKKSFTKLSNSLFWRIII